MKERKQQLEMFSEPLGSSLHKQLMRDCLRQGGRLGEA